MIKISLTGFIVLLTFSQVAGAADIERELRLDCKNGDACFEITRSNDNGKTFKSVSGGLLARSTGPMRFSVKENGEIVHIATKELIQNSLVPARSSPIFEAAVATEAQILEALKAEFGGTIPEDIKIENRIKVSPKDRVPGFLIKISSAGKNEFEISGTSDLVKSEKYQSLLKDFHAKYQMRKIADYSLPETLSGIGNKDLLEEARRENRRHK